MEQLTENTVKSIAQKGCESLFFFARGILAMKDLTFDIHKPICDALQDAANKRLMIMLPRDWFKSSLGSIAFPIWCAINNPNIRILIAQNSFTNACKKLNNISEIFEKNQLFRACYQSILPTSSCNWSKECLTVNRSITAPEGTFEAAGIGTSITSRHYDIVIEDDTVTPDKDALTGQMAQPTKAEIEKAIGWHKLVHPLLINPKVSRIIIIGTRWAPGDLLGYIIDNCHEYKVISRAVRERDGVPCTKLDGGVPVWDRFDDETLDNLERDLGPYIFNSLYMNNPTEAANQKFKRDWIQYYSNLPAVPLAYFTSVDPAPSDSDMTEDPDYSVVLTTAINPKTMQIYVVHYDRGRFDPGELIDLIFYHNRTYRPVKVMIEGIAYQRTLGFWTQYKQRMLNEFFNVEVLKSYTSSKAHRILGLVPFFSNNRIMIKPSMPELENELLMFPSYRVHDDIIDALSMHAPEWNECSMVRQADQNQKLLNMPFSGLSLLQDLDTRNNHSRMRDGALQDVGLSLVLMN